MSITVSPYVSSTAERRRSMSPRPAPSRAVADEGASIATVEGIDGRVQADHARPGVRRAPWQAEVNYLFGLEDARALYLIRPHL